MSKNFLGYIFVHWGSAARQTRVEGTRWLDGKGEYEEKGKRGSGGTRENGRRERRER